ncbi:uroporphyrinogen decarboxylase family protein [Archaeoglobus veneficus]|uniref:Uroporphyrinogen decarboxylase (URO-D) domain-containing protein n=1 Tax=Archaeoglobus veneficus (strain DSM 11195 / SNP6) TaxID=693661 RepID=F2KSS1_ARCVS|nr:uroporphyrinogen decarboxylase family protein [Archaeoglobus veneficus]AEA46966.1 hypothetical protein Arcve_0955 [Archaeoglobus veneficus SNP6]
MEVYIFAPYHGAKALGIGRRMYFSSAHSIFMGQKLLQRMLGHDCLYAAVPGVEVEFFLSKYTREPQPLVMSEEDIDALEVGEEGKFASAMLRAISMLSEEDFVVGACLSPLKLASMLSTLKGEAKLRLAERLLPFCSEWIKRQFEEGADMVILFDESNEEDRTPKSIERVEKLAWKDVCYAGGRIAEIAELIEKAGFSAAIVSSKESILEVRKRCSLTLLGNISAERMKNWNEEKAEEEAKRCVEEGLTAGNFVFSPDGEVPYHTGFATLRAAVRAAREAEERLNKD